MDSKTKSELEMYLLLINTYVELGYYSKRITSKIKALQIEISDFMIYSDFDTKYNTRKAKFYLNKLGRVNKITQDWFFNKFIDSDEYVPKTYYILRKYGNQIKLIGKAKEPSKAINRDRASFKHNDVKLPNSISRTRQKVYELLMCNHWDFFVNFKINTKMFDGCDLDGFMGKFSKWLNNYSNRKTGGVKIQYVLVPELGRKGTWHLHGVMNGIPQEHLSPFIRGDHPARLVNSSYLNWKAYEKDFGFCAIGYGIRNILKVAGYMTKRLKKSAKIGKRGLHKPLCYCSKNLKRSEEIARGYDLFKNVDFDYENDFTGIKWLDEYL